MPTVAQHYGLAHAHQGAAPLRAGEEQRDESCVAARKGEKSVLVHGSPFLAVST